NNTIGGAVTGAGNVISGNTGDGLRINSGQSGTLVQGNMIGTNAAGNAALANGLNGVEIEGSNNTVGGTAIGGGNTFAFSQDLGISLSGGTGDGIHQNSIFANGQFGINLFNANGGQFPPALSSATFNSTTKTLTVKGTLNTTASTKFTLEFFANPAG